MNFSQLALSFVLTAGSTMAAGTAQFPKPADRKLSKKKKAFTPKQWAVIGTNSIQGTYMYTNKCNNVFQATIECGPFGDGDPELCMFSEYKVGDAVPEEVTGNRTSVPLQEGGYFVPNDELPLPGQLIDPNVMCIFSGTFRASSAMDGNIVEPIPLATSNGCPTTTTNFQTVVKGMMKEDGNLELDFSGDYGVSYYTKEKPLNSYMGKKLANDIVDRGRALSRGDDGDGSMHMHHRHLLVMIPVLWASLLWESLLVAVGYSVVSVVTNMCFG